MSVGKKIEELFHLLDQSSTYIAEEYNKKYLEALIDTAEQFFQGELVLETASDQKSKLEAYIHTFNQLALSNEEIRRSLQLAILKGMKEEHLPGTGVTPDAVAMLLAFLAQKLNSEPTSIFDPASGTANLLTCVLNQYPQHQINGYGIEVDPTLVRLAYVNTNLQQHEVELYHQDALKPVYTPPADLTICDLPIGIYPNSQVAKNYQLYTEQAELYTHHLLMEKALMLTAEGGYLLFLIPNNLFIEQGAERLRQLITEQAYVQALLQLPQTLFQEGSILKSIFILQKKGKQVKNPKEILIASLPSFSEPQAFSKVIDQINHWLAAEKGQLMV